MFKNKKFFASLVAFTFAINTIGFASTVSSVQVVDSDVPMGFSLPMGVFSIDENLYVLDTFNNLLRTINDRGKIITVAGNVLMLDQSRFARGFYRNGTIETSLFNRPTSAIVNENGHVFIADSANNAIRVIVDGYTTTLVGGPTADYLNNPTALAFDMDGSILVADSNSHTIKRVSLDGDVTVVAGTPGEFGSTDGEDARFNTPMGIAVGADGTIFVADTGNHLIRVIRDGCVSTLAGTFTTFDDESSDDMFAPIGGFLDGEESMFDMPTGLAIFNDILIVADAANHRIRGVLPNGEVFTIAGNGYSDYVDCYPLNSSFHLPQGLYVQDSQLFIIDTGNNLIRILDLAFLL